jgi:hypothetical protein
MRLWRQGVTDQRRYCLTFLRVLAGISIRHLVVSWWYTRTAAPLGRGLSPDEIQTGLNPQRREWVTAHAAKEAKDGQEDVTQDCVEILPD